MSLYTVRTYTVLIIGIWDKNCSEKMFMGCITVCLLFFTKPLSYPFHKLTNLNFIHQTYLTPKWHFMMNISTSPNCYLYGIWTKWGYFYITFKCSSVKCLGTNNTAPGVETACSPDCMLLNDDYRQNLDHTQRQLWLSACTAFKKILLLRWLSLHVSVYQWNHSLIEILFMALPDDVPLNESCGFLVKN